MEIRNKIAIWNQDNSHKIAGLSHKKVAEKMAVQRNKKKEHLDPSIISMDQRIRKQNSGILSASENTRAGISCMQTADVALKEVNDLLQRMNELATLAANKTHTKEESQMLQDEIDESIREIDRIANNASFGGEKLFNGTLKEEGHVESTTTTSTITIQKPVKNPAIIDLMGNKFYLSGSKDALTDEEAKDHIAKGDDLFLTPSFGDKTDIEIKANTIAIDLKTTSGEFSFISIGKHKVTKDELGSNHITVEELANHCNTVKEYEGFTFQASGSSLFITAKDGTFPDKLKIKWNNTQYEERLYPGLSPDDKPVIGNKPSQNPAQIKAEEGKDYIYKPGSTNFITSTSVIKNTVINYVEDRFYKQLHFQVSDEPATFATIRIDRMNSVELGLKNVDVSSSEKAASAQKTIQKAIEKIDKQRQYFGSANSRFQHTARSLHDADDKNGNTLSRMEIADTDEEAVKNATSNIKSMVDEAVLAQANQNNERTLGLLIG